MRPALQALAEQQKVIDQLRRHAVRQDQSIQHLAKGLQCLASMAGVQDKVAAAMIKKADVQNPAQPVPEPPAGPPVESTQEAKTPEAFADVQAPGLVPGSTNDVAADATTTAYTPGMDVAGPAFHELVDVTAPVDGTQGPRPLQETKTLTDVRVGDPMNPQTAYPLQGQFQNAQRTSSKTAARDASLRTMAALRLARLQIEAGTAETESDFALAASIEKDASVSTEAIEAEIATLEKVKRVAHKRAASARLVPQSANRRQVPSMQGTSRTASAAPVSDETADADLFD